MQGRIGVAGDDDLFARRRVALGDRADDVTALGDTDRRRERRDRDLDVVDLDMGAVGRRGDAQAADARLLVGESLLGALDLLRGETAAGERRLEGVTASTGRSIAA